MEVKSGYKQTDLGVIPEDWAIAALGKLSDFITSGSRGWARYYSDRGALFIRSQNVRDGLLDFEDSQFVNPPKGSEGSRTQVKLNDLLITVTGNSVGNVALVEQELNEAYISQHVGLVRLRKPTRGQYVCRFLSPGSLGNGQIIASQSGQSKPGLTLKNLHDFQIALPPTDAEQIAIVGTLSDMDALHGELDRLIAKKRDIKQAAMQQLLTGQTRLPGFHDEWSVKRLGELLDYEQPTKYLVKNSEYSDNNNVPVLTAGKTFILGYTNEENGIYGNLPAIIFDDFTTAMKYVTFPFKAKSSAMKILKPRDTTINLRLVFEIMQSIEFKLGDHKRYWISEYQNLQIKFPDSKEQNAIADVLTDMDAELAALEQRREKTRALKQGMMQELLTGRTRLR